ncbi:phage tail tape measure protein [uncultured Bilophila sp.]|uniref:phage tail tape measure protein n=1 Tax=Desulfovibrio sp. TaxID=885 RepID=UPI00266F04F4|nr:phage tail tape measure protein [uncultured Bilophila sp.]
MEVFSVFATLSLVDMLSSPLDRIKRAMKGVDLTTAGLGQRMGNLALAMGPAALAAGLLVGAFGSCVGVAAGFEDQMAKVGAVSRASSEEMAALEATARELGATTQFTAVQVGQAEQYLAMAGFSAKENIAALPGVLNLAAATATDLGRAADISSDILSAFGLKAEQMTRVADVLALTCATANTNMELLGDTMKYVAPVARMAGLSLEQTAAMAGLLGNVGIKGSQAGTTLKAMLNKMAAPTKEAQALFQKLGVTVKDSAGNLRSPVAVLGEMAAGLKNMGTAEQIAAMKTIVGEEAIAGFAELIQKEGIGAIADYARQLEAGGGSAAEMAARMNDTLAGSLRGLGSAWESVRITVGKLFLPAVRAVVDAVTALLRLLDQAAQTPFGAALLKIVSAVSLAVLAVTGFAAGLWAVSKAAPFVSSSLLAIKTALLGLGWPVWALIAAVGLLYAAWKKDFGGIATTLSRWGRNISLVVRGVTAVFGSLKDGVGEIRGELAEDIKAEGLVGIVTTVARVAYRIKEFFTGIWEGLNFDGAVVALTPAILKVRDLFDSLGELIGRVFGTEVKSASSEARSLGEILGGVLSIGLELVATVIANVVRGIDSLVSLVRLVCALFTGDWVTATAMAENIWTNFCDSLMAFADYFRIGDWIRDAWAQATEWLSGLDLFESGARLLDTFKEGILSKVESLKQTFSDALGRLRDLLPFSDAKEGPLSTLTLSGARLMSTLSEGMNAGFPGLYATLSGKLGSLKESIGTWWDGLWGDKGVPVPATGEAPVVPDAPGLPADVAEARTRQGLATGEQTAASQSWTLHIANITLPNVKDAQDFYADLQAAATEMGGSLA